MAKVDEARQGAIVQIVDRAIVPDRRSSPQRTLIILGTAMLGLFLGVVWAFAAEGLARFANDQAPQHSQVEKIKQMITRGEKSESRL
jgi:uncharacterized protein involved in exopolysaccharide biosynthesis